MRIVELQAENVKRLKAVSIKPDGNVVVIGGNNGEGKTSTLDAIMYALGGKAAIPDEPVRHGEKKAKVTLDLDEYTVTRTMTPGGGGTLTVKGKDGGKYEQTLLNSFLGSISLDPLAFTRMSAKDQAEALRKMLGLDFSMVDHKRQALYDERTLIGREVKSLKGQLDGLPEHDLPEDMSMSMSDLLKKLDEVQDHNSEVRAAKNNLSYWCDQIEDSRMTIERLKQELEEAEREMNSRQQKFLEAEKEADGLEEIDEGPIRQQMAKVEEVSSKIRDNETRAGVVKMLEEKESEYSKLTGDIASIDKEKADALATVKMPLDGLSIEDGELRFNGTIFSECSGAEKLRVSVAMACAASPDLKVFLVRDGSLMDDASMKMLAEIAAEHDAQVWVERVGEGDEGERYPCKPDIFWKIYERIEE